MVGISFLMTLIGLSPGLGTVLAGVVLANNEFQHELESDIEPSRLNALSRQSGYAVQDDNSFETSNGETFEYPF